MRIWMNSCHAAFEYDLALMLKAYGNVELDGIFDYGSKQRPKVKGFTDKDAPGHIHDKAKTLELTADDIGHPDIVICHQTSDYPARAAMYAAMGIPVIVTIFGQGNMTLHDMLAKVAKRYFNVHIVTYSLKAQRIYDKLLGESRSQAHFIRFGKPYQEFNPDHWTGEDPVCFVPHNSVHRRGEGCGWPIVSELISRGVPIRLAGKDTEEVGGLGEITYEELKSQYKKCRVMFSPGTHPAPYTLTFVEAVCSGTPVIVNDSKSGLSQEGLPVVITEGVEEAYTAITNALLNDRFNEILHDNSRMMWQNDFGAAMIWEQWGSLLSSLV